MAISENDFDLAHIDYQEQHGMATDLSKELLSSRLGVDKNTQRKLLQNNLNVTEENYNLLLRSTRFLLSKLKL